MKIAIVSGASSGIGREFVRQLSKREGEHIEEIWLIARREDLLQKLVSEINMPLRIFALDLLKPNSFLVLKETLQILQPQIHCLVNAAGYAKFGEALQIKEEDSLGMIDLNCRALVALTQLALPYMTSGDRIINIASTASFFPLQYANIYSASKVFVLYYSKALAFELKKKHIGVTALTPGPVQTDFWEIASESMPLKSLSQSIFRSTPEKVVKKALKDAFRGKTVSTPGCSNVLHKIMAKLLPTCFLMWVWEKIR
ncbi:MAG: SDR family NAD(P)-dependent oxidoreductase [Bacteroidales bacterium]